MPFSSSVVDKIEAMRRESAELKRGVRPFTGIWADVYSSVNVSIAVSGTPQAIALDSIETDPTGMFVITPPATTSTRVTIDIPGRYSGIGQVRFASNATGYRQVFIRINGSISFASALIPAVNGQVTDVPCPFEKVLLQGDYVEMLAAQTSGGALNVLFVANLSPFLRIKRTS